MFDIEVFRYELLTDIMRVTQVRSYRDGVLQTRIENPIDVEIDREGLGENFSCDRAYRFLQKALPAPGPATVRRSRAALLLDDDGLRITEGWNAFALMVLAIFTTGPFDRSLFATSDEQGGRAIELNTSVGRMLGFLHHDGRIDVVRPALIGHAVHYMRDNGWIKVALHLSLEHRGPAPSSMVAVAGSRMSGMVLHEALRTTFWRDVAAVGEDPWLKQEPVELVRGRTWYEDRRGHDCVYLQPRPELTFDVGSERELVDLLYSYFALLIAGGRGGFYVESLENLDSFAVKFIARFAENPSATFIGTSARPIDQQDHPIIDAIVAIMQPTGHSLRGGPRLSQAEKVSAAFSCILEYDGFGFLGRPAHDRSNLMSAHEVLGHTARLAAFLERYGKIEAAALVEAL